MSSVFSSFVDSHHLEELLISQWPWKWQMLSHCVYKWTCDYTHNYNHARSLQAPKSQWKKEKRQCAFFINIHYMKLCLLRWINFMLLTQRWSHDNTVLIIVFEIRLVFIPPLKHHWRAIHPPFWNTVDISWNSKGKSMTQFDFDVYLGFFML